MAISARARSTRCASRCLPRWVPIRRRAKTAILGILSLIIWALILIVTVKYVLILLRADNNGEGGTLALDGACQPRARRHSSALIVVARHDQRRAVLWRRHDHARAFGAVGRRRPRSRDAGARSLCRAAYGRDPVRAVRWCSRTARRGWRAFFGPITLVWFVALAAAGLWHVAPDPSVLAAFNPLHGVSFLLSHGYIGLLTLGAVFLVVTGAEALYADLGHFGRGPIRTAWLTVVSAGAHAQLSRPGRAAACATRRRSKIRSFCSIRTGRCSRWWCSPPPPR